MRPFILLDLLSQADCVPAEVRTWPRQQVLDWMRLYGEVREWPLSTGEMASDFRAPSGLATVFMLTEDGTLTIYLGEHRLLTVWERGILKPLAR